MVSSKLNFQDLASFGYVKILGATHVYGHAKVIIVNKRDFSQSLRVKSISYVSFSHAKMFGVTVFICHAI